MKLMMKLPPPGSIEYSHLSNSLKGIIPLRDGDLTPGVFPIVKVDGQTLQDSPLSSNATTHIASTLPVTFTADVAIVSGSVSVGRGPSGNAVINAPTGKSVLVTVAGSTIITVGSGQTIVNGGVWAKPGASNTWALLGFNASTPIGGIFVDSSGRGSLLLYPGAGGLSYTVQITGSSNPSCVLIERSALAGGNVSADFRIIRGADSTLMGFVGCSAGLDMLMIAYQGRAIIQAGVTAGTAEVLLQTGSTTRVTVANSLVTFAVPGRIDVPATNSYALSAYYGGNLIGGIYNLSPGGGRLYLQTTGGTAICDIRSDGAFLPSPGSPFAGGSLPDGSVSFSFDGSGDLLITGKTPGGTVKTATITMT